MASHADPIARQGLETSLSRRSSTRIEGWVLGARGHLFPFAPVALGIGIGVYFALPVEPTRPTMGLVASVAALLAACARWMPEGLRPLAWALVLGLAGLLLAGVRTALVAAPVLERHRYGPIEGRIVAVDRSGSDALRLTLDRVVLPDLSPEATPARVRVSVHGGPLDVDPIAGRRVMLTGFVGPPGAPVEPGGFDFRRHAWFERLGGVGYTRSPVLAVSHPEPGLALALTRLRQSISAGIRGRLPGETGGFVAAILTGDRSGVGQETLEDLRRSNLAHLLAISGLHMGLLTGAVYGALRFSLALFPLVALRLPIRKLAAIGALAAATFYLALSGGNIATQRAFVMAAVMLGAVLVDRRALSLRSVALAALILLAWRPEALLGAGFQMSFAATVALVATFRALRDWRLARGHRTRPGRAAWIWQPLASAALCSLVAGLATAPISAASFNRVAEYGLAANLLAVPLMGLLVMPAAVLSAVLWPVGLSTVGLRLMELGTRWILGVAEAIAGLDGAVRAVPSPPGWVIPALALGALWLILWPGRARWCGPGLVVASLAGWGFAERPALLIDREGALVGLMTAEGRALSKPRGAGYSAREWLASDGDMAAQSEAALRPGFEPVFGGVRFTFAGEYWLHLYGRDGERALGDACRAGVTVVSDAWIGTAPGACLLIDRAVLAETGALALGWQGTRRAERSGTGFRPWAR